jgi:hypothetical protein
MTIYKVISAECKWTPQGGLINTEDDRPFETQVIAFCEANKGASPSGGVSVTVVGNTLLVSQAVAGVTAT